jgi:hypothetical protein
VTTPILSKRPAPDNGALLDAALSYANRGWSIIAVIGKRAAGLWKRFQNGPADEHTLRRLFAGNGVSGLAVITGRVSGGLGIRDFDNVGAYRAWADANPDDASVLPTVQTHRGYHVFGRLDHEEFANLGDGELRANCGHYVLLPPSLHPDGSIYTWVNPLTAESVGLPLLPLSLLGGRRDPATLQPMQPIACVPQAAIDAIEATLPDGPGKRNRKVFDLARRLKGIAGMDTAPSMLKAIVVEWHRRALPVITTKAFAETWNDFQIAWKRVKQPHRTKVQDAYQAARRALPASIDESVDLGVLAAMCRNLSPAAGGRPFYLACRTVQELFGVSRMTAWRWLQALQFYGVIEEVKKGTLNPRRATTWLAQPAHERGLAAGPD